MPRRRPRRGRLLRPRRAARAVRRPSDSYTAFAAGCDRLASPLVAGGDPDETLTGRPPKPRRDERQEEAASHELERRMQDEGIGLFLSRKRHDAGRPIEQLGVREVAEAGAVVLVVDVVGVDAEVAVGTGARLHGSERTTST